MYKFRTANINDLHQIAALEQESFIPEVADTEGAFKERIDKISDTFIVAEKEGDIAGYINGPVIEQPYITDDLFKKIPDTRTGDYLCVLGLAVSRRHQRQGLAGQLIDRFTALAEGLKLKAITLTCTEDLVPFYERYGFKSHGPSASQHGGEQWFNMIKEV
ncbi:GNAT family N-acetyltransferase [Macrococcus hajekii]|uniref:GNAT family N-acetyltransferase n=1 Tax=Macrococcus hajekii TaxID=198482 RepID=A0A4V3BDZ7_9STAP|nr:GNAT family N-acetyltransferase [Macrococcus hajekii]TDM02084.1 GNAT family N-acetyltransferase [Macrococcus hajekii]GGB09968.1 N-acetyltransferase [Macrococcus hajekii]